MADTHGAILDLIRSGGEISRVELALRSGLTEASVSRIVKQLLLDGVIAETGRGISTGGKRPTLLQLNSGSRHAVGILVSETRVEYVVTDLAGKVIAASEAPGMAHQSRAELVGRAVVDVEAMLAQAGVALSTVLGIGVATPGRQEFRDYSTAQNPFDYTEWVWGLIEADLAAASGRPISVENDSTCAAIGEFWSSRAPTAKDFGVVNIANGIGFGLVTAGDVYRGASSNVGEIGHTILDVNGQECPCGNRGCLETMASTPRIVADALAQPDLVARLGLTGTVSEMWEDYERICIAAAAGDEEAARPIIDAARLIGKALVSVTNVLDLERIVLTGPALDHVGRIFTDVVSDELDHRAFVRNVHPTEVSLSESGRHSAAVGAATLIIHERLGAIRRPRDLAG
jgi:predicted NBD/HSP70 family sugar kinase